MKGHQKKQEENPLHKHDQAEHDGDKATYSYEPMGFFQDPLTRQVNEGVRINQSIAEGALMGATNELTRRVPTRFRTKDRDRIKKEW